MAAAAITSFASAASGAVTLPSIFNFSHDGLINTLKLVFVPTAGAVFLYLKKSPMPDTIMATVDETGKITEVSGSVEVGLKSK